MFRIRTYILLALALSLAATVSGQTDFKGVFNGGASYIFIRPQDTLYIDGNLINATTSESNIVNQGTIILTGNLVNYAGTLFDNSSVSSDAVVRGKVIFDGEHNQIIYNSGAGAILFADLSIRDSVELCSDIHVVGTLTLDQFSEPNLLNLNSYTLKMYQETNESGDGLFGGIIEGEDETHFITSDSIGKISMHKRYVGNDSIALPAFKGMGLTIEPSQPNSSGRVIVERSHAWQENAGWGSINKYYSIKIIDGSGFDRLSVKYFDHDLNQEHGDKESLRLFYSHNEGSSYELIESESDSANSIVKTEDVKTDSSTFRYTIAAICQLDDFTLGSDLEVCRGNRVTLTPQWLNNQQPSNNYFYIWNDDESTREYKGNTTSKSFILTNDTTIWIQVADSRGCMAFDTIHIKVLELPDIPSIIIPTATSMYCISETLAFNTDAIAEHTYRWDFGDQTSAAGNSATKNYTVPDSYSVILTVENKYFCTAAASVQIHVEDMPVADFETNMLSEKRVQFIVQSQTSSKTKRLEWKIDGEIYEGNPDNVEFSDFGEYLVTLTVISEKCSASVSKLISITEMGALNFNITNQSLCQGSPLQFNVDFNPPWGNMAYIWDFGDGTKSNEKNPVKTYSGSETTVYTVTLTVQEQNTGWSAEITRDITVDRPPRINWGGAISTCAGSWELKPEDTNPGYSYQWSTGATTESINVTANGQYSLLLTNANGCSSLESVYITLNSAVVPAINDMQSCGAVILDAGNPGSTYIWTQGSTVIGTGRTLPVEQSGTYTVAVTQANGCTGTKTVTVIISEKPTVKIQGSATLCEGLTATLYTADEPNTAYLWNTGETTPSITISGEGWYRVTATNLITNCTASDSLYVIGLSAPIVSLGSDRNVCIGQETTLVFDEYHYASAVEWWSNGGTVYSGRSFAVSDTGTYYLRVTLSNGCATTGSIRFGGIASPLTIDFLAASQSYVGDTLVFIDLSYPDPVSWSWEISSGYRTNEPVFQYAFWNEGEYSVKLSVDNGGCVLSKTKTVTVGSSPKKEDYGDGSKGDNDYLEMIPEKPLYESPSAIMDVIVMPNPSDGDFRIQVRLERPSRIVARLYTLTGQQAASFIIPEQTEEAMHSCNFSNLPKGIYLLQLLTDSDMKTVRIVIQ